LAIFTVICVVLLQKQAQDFVLLRGQYKLPTTVGSRTFNVSGPRIWNGLPEDVVSAPTFLSFRRRRTFLFQQSYPDSLLSSNCTFDTIVVLLVMFYA